MGSVYDVLFGSLLVTKGVNDTLEGVKSNVLLLRDSMLMSG